MSGDRGARSSRLARELRKDARSAERWGLALDDLSIGPFRLGSGSVSSGDVPQKGKKRSSMVGLASRSEDIQVVLPEMVREYRDGHPIDVWVGTEYVSAIGSADVTGNLTGDVLLSFPINPTNFVRTRLAQISPLYQRYRFRRLIFHYQPVAPATTSGQLIGFGDYDIENPLTIDSPDNVNVAAAHLGQKITQVWEFCNFPFGVVDSFTTLFTALENASDDRLVYQGNYYLIAASDLAPALPLGNIYVSYEIEFSIPQLFPASEGPGPIFVVGERYDTETSGGLSAENLFGDGTATSYIPAQLGGGVRTFLTDTVTYSGIPGGRYQLVVTAQATGTNSVAGNYSFDLDLVTSIVPVVGSVEDEYVTYNQGATSTTVIGIAAHRAQYDITDGSFLISISDGSGAPFAGTYQFCDLTLFRIGPVPTLPARKRPQIRLVRRERVIKETESAKNYWLKKGRRLCPSGLGTTVCNSEKCVRDIEDLPLGLGTPCPESGGDLTSFVPKRMTPRTVITHGKP